MRRPRPPRGCRAIGKKKWQYVKAKLNFLFRCVFGNVLDMWIRTDILKNNIKTATVKVAKA
jgi:hypothetical protein